MKINCAFLLAMSLAALLDSSPACAQSEAMNASPHAYPKVDARGFIDVWQLRDDVAALEVLEASDDTYYCEPEGDGKESQAELKRMLQKKKFCEDEVRKAFAHYDKAKKAFNLAWGPLIHTAIRRGDHVAEVIMRQCDTTPVLDRDGIESTCDGEDARRHAVAVRRLAEIGFVPAIDIRAEIDNLQGLEGEKQLRQIVNNQTAVMKKMRAGALAFDPDMVKWDGNAPRNAIELATIRRWTVMEAVVEDAPRAFTISALDYFHSGVALPSLRLNRKPQASHARVPTWGRSQYYERQNSDYARTFYWRSKPRAVYMWGRQVEDRPVVIAGTGVADFEQARTQLLAEIASNIDRYLAQDPRWGVFLLERIGHHEWAPKGMQSATKMLAPAWEGTWIVDKEAQDWSSSPMFARTGRAVIKRDGEYTRMSMTIEGAQEPLLNVVDCTLRYSGGTVDGTSLMANNQIASAEASAPLKAKTMYKQVLMQCDNAEAADVDRVRFLLLAGDVLVEIGANSVFGKASVRHYHRLKG